MRLIDGDKAKINAITDDLDSTIWATHINNWIDIQPTVKVEITKQGKWVDKEIYPGLLRAACSECGTFCNDYRCEQVLTKYCPECGAKLVTE